MSHLRVLEYSGKYHRHIPFPVAALFYLWRQKISYFLTLTNVLQERKQGRYDLMP